MDSQILLIKKKIADIKSDQNAAQQKLQECNTCNALTAELKTKLAAAETELQTLKAQKSSMPAPSVPAPPKAPRYIGCFRDNDARTMEWNNVWVSHDMCQKMAESTGRKYFATQATNNEGVAACMLAGAGDDKLNKIKQLGAADNCSVINGNMAGAGWSNAVYELP